MKLYLQRFIALSFGLLGLTCRADIAWIDIDDPSGTTAQFHTSLPAVEGGSVSAGGITFTVFGSIGGSRDRGLADAMLSDFAFKEGADQVAVGLRLSGLPAGTYQVESWHYDGNGAAGAVQVEFRPQGGSTTLLVDNFAFSTSPASYQITANGTATYELVFREDDSNNRTRLNGFRIRAIGAPVAPPLVYVDADNTNTVAASGAPSPFWTASLTTDNLWRKRTGFGFDVNSRREIFEKDASSGGNGVGDATPLRTTVASLQAGQSYGVYVCYLSATDAQWRVRAGISASPLIEFTSVMQTGRVTDLGPTSESGSNRRQYLGFVGNIAADSSGEIVVDIDDGEGTGDASRTWFEGVAIGSPYTVPTAPALPAGAVEIASNGAWTWFNDERAIYHQGFLYSGYVLSDGRVGVTRYNPATQTGSQSILSTAASQQVDDHNNPSFTVLPNGRLLAVYSKHNVTADYFQRTSNVAAPATDADWGPEQKTVTPAVNTYANTYQLSAEANKIFNFHRCINFNPTLSISTNNGATWGTATQLISTGAGGTRPYGRYCSNLTDRIDMIYTDGHPRDADNSIYHLYYQNGTFRKSDGAMIRALANLPINHDVGERGSIVYQFSSASWGGGQGPNDWIPNGRAWTWDIQYDKGGKPVCTFQVQRDDVTGIGWNNDRIYYYYARWTGTSWQRRFIAHAGRPLYAGEDDYAGGMTIDPEDTRVVYISTNAASPFNLTDINNVPLNLNSRYELWRGFTRDGGSTFEWTPVTSNSAADNLRPIVPENHGRTRNVLWFFGTYNTYQNFSTQVIGLFGEARETLEDWRSSYNLETGPSLDSDLDGLEDLLEYSLGGNPIDSADRQVPVLEAGKFTFPYLPRRTDATSVVEMSQNLVDWSPFATIEAAGLPASISPGYLLEPGAFNPGTLSFSPVPLNSFIRLRVQTGP